MKLQLRLFLKATASFFVACISGCAPSVKDRDPGATYFMLPWPNAAHEIVIQNVKINTMTKISKIDGKAARFLIAPSDYKKRLKGLAPTARYSVTADKVVVPTDLLTTQLFTLYAHFEKLAAFDKKAGSYSLLSWPRTVGVGANMPTVRENNAVYSGQMDAILFVPYTRNGTAMYLNPGIIAHEHFHAIFTSAFVTPLKIANRYPDDDETAHSTEEIADAFDLQSLSQKRKGSNLSAYEAYHIMVYRGLNEGLADLWAWFYTNDSNFLAKSLPEARESRSLAFKPDRVLNQNSIRGTIAGFQGTSSFAYVIGTQYARAFRAWTELLAREKNISLDEMKILMAQHLIKSLSAMAKDVSQQAEGTYFNPDQILLAFNESLKSENPSFYPHECKFLTDVSADPSTFKKQCEGGAR